MALIRWRSLKARVTLFTLVIFVCSVWSLAIYASLRLRGDMQRLLGKQQLATASFRADEVNRALNERLGALGRTAALLEHQALGNRAALADFLNARPVLQNLFNGGVSVFDARGKMVGGTLPAVGRFGLNGRDRDEIAAALDDGKTTIGVPRVDPYLLVPAFEMSVPIRDDAGNIVGALSGTTLLDRAGFLDQIIESYYGNSGYYLLVDPQNRVIVSDTGKKRLLEALPAPGKNALFDRFVAGSDEAGVTHDTDAVEILASAKRVYLTDWFIVAALPTEEAFAPIAAMQRYMLQATALLTLLAGALTWWMIRRELSPVLSTMQTLATLAKSDEAPQALPVASHDEIGELIGGFNHLLGTLRQRETSLHNTLRFLQALMDAVPSPLFYKDANGIYLGCNVAYTRYFGRSRTQLIGKTIADLFPPDLAAIYAHADRALFDHPGVQTYEAAVAHADGTRHQAVFNKATFTNSEGKVAGIVGVILDVTERKLAEDKIRNLAFYDQLTGLPNRRLLTDRLQQTMAASRRSGAGCALMFLDLDNFKPLNDIHGHAAGDLLLAEAADRLRRCVREADTVARFGGDEFVIVVCALSTQRSEAAEQAARIAEKIRAALSESYHLTISREGQPPCTFAHHCTASLGVAMLHDEQTTSDDLLTRADAALYQAKAAGRNQVHFHFAHAADEIHGEPPAGTAQVK